MLDAFPPVDRHHQIPSGYKIPAHDVMFINCDADLDSSTKRILRYIGPHIKPGDFLYFDEFHHWADERPAFEEFQAVSGLSILSGWIFVFEIAGFV
jgi:hypothetical protein